MCQAKAVNVVFAHENKRMLGQRWACLTYALNISCVLVLMPDQGLPMTPSDNEYLATGLAHSGQLADELSFVWHVLTALH